MTSTLSKAEAIAAAMKIDGWLTVREASLLYDMAKSATGPIIEIGSWRGRSTAVLGFGSMAGGNHPVFAVDSFVGVPPSDRITANGENPGWSSSSPQILRANLDAAGVNGLVKIIPVASADAAEHLPDCTLLFVDGGHDYATVARDFDCYLPKLAEGGSVVVHDYWELDPEVIKATDEKLLRHGWQYCRKVDSAIVVTRKQAERHKVFLAFPGSRPVWGSVKGLMQGTLGAHDVTVVNNANGWDDMNFLWVQALNAAKRGVITHFAMLHSDVAPDPGWIDTLLCELDETGADLVSVPIPIKDRRGLTSSGIGNADDHWNAYRRFTMHELMQLPETFSIADTPHPDRYLLHNSGCWACDLRRPVFFETDAEGCLRTCFNFPLRARMGEDGMFIHERESEDWYFSRQLNAVGAKTAITRKVEVFHVGDMEFANSSAWGKYRSDEETKCKWDRELAVSSGQ